MGRYNPDSRVIELDTSDEPHMKRHFGNARTAWTERQQVVEGNYGYTPDIDGVWGSSIGVPKREYFWSKQILESKPNQ
jgi:hypothetical protein